MSEFQTLWATVIKRMDGMRHLLMIDSPVTMITTGYLSQKFLVVFTRQHLGIAN